MAKGGEIVSAIDELRHVLVDESGAAEPRRIAALLGRLGLDQRDHPIALLGHAVICRIGDLKVSNDAHRVAAEALKDDAAALLVALSSWLGAALSERDAALLGELHRRASAIEGPNNPGCAIVTTIEAAGAVVAGRFEDVESMLAPIAAGRLALTLRGPIAFLRSVALQARGMIDASVAVLDADEAHLGVFDLASAMIRSRRDWLGGEQRAAIARLEAINVAARARGRQHDGDVSAVMARLCTILLGDQPLVPRPVGSTPVVSSHLLIEDALAMLPDEPSARRHLEAHPEVLRVSAEFLHVPYVLCPGYRPAIDLIVGSDTCATLVAAKVFVAARELNEDRPVEPWHLDRLLKPWADQLANGPSTKGEAGTRSASALVGSDTEVAQEKPVIKVFGPIRIVNGDGDRAIRRERVRALIAALAVHRRLSRDRLIDMLWPDMTPERGANNLRATLSYTRRLADTAILRTNGPIVELIADVDVWRFERHVADAREAASRNGCASTALASDDAQSQSTRAWCAAADLVEGRFAEDVGDALWLDTARFGIDALAVDALIDAARICASSDTVRSRGWLQRVLQLEPWNERAIELLARSRPETNVPTTDSPTVAPPESARLTTDSVHARS